jgi:DNA-directed RNA polymerase specialized sigma24 family protein
MKTEKPNRPWLTSSEVEIPTFVLREICKGWDRETWERYLSWYESSIREKLIDQDLYDDICDRQTQSIFSLFDQDNSIENKKLCESLLRSIPQEESKVLRLVYFQGKTIRDIAYETNQSKSTVHFLKNKGLKRLQRGQDGEKLDTRHLMRSMAPNSDEKSPWSLPLNFLLKEARMYDPKRHGEEFAKIKHTALRIALQDLTDKQQRILYLRFWCDYSIKEIAQELNTGMNLVDQVCDATVSKLKRRILEIEYQLDPNGGPSCA